MLYDKALKALSSIFVLSMVEIANLYLNDGFFSQCAVLEYIVILPYPSAYLSCLFF